MGRSSLSAASTPSTARALSPSLHSRRNRSALRDYYNLKQPQSQPQPHLHPQLLQSVASATSDESGVRRSPTTEEAPEHAVSVASPSLSGVGVPVAAELDSPNFDAQRYVDHLLATSSLSTILKAENTLVGDIRTLDGERKALVYDNYSKLIRAVETIGKMRQSMDQRGAPLTMTRTLAPAIAFVAETASTLIQEGEEQRRRIQEAKTLEAARSRSKVDEKETVRWVLAAPKRLERLVAKGKAEEAQRDWDEISRLLDRWDGVKGVLEVRRACEKVMEQAATATSAQGDCPPLKEQSSE